MIDIFLVIINKNYTDIILIFSYMKDLQIIFFCVEIFFWKYSHPP